eukprot:116579-Pelagomonas_calceolata.AAC.5
MGHWWVWEIVIATMRLELHLSRMYANLEGHFGEGGSWVEGTPGGGSIYSSTNPPDPPKAIEIEVWQERRALSRIMVSHGFSLKAQMGEASEE